MAAIAFKYAACYWCFGNMCNTCGGWLVARFRQKQSVWIVGEKAGDIRKPLTSTARVQAWRAKKREEKRMRKLFATDLFDYVRRHPDKLALVISWLEADSLQGAAAAFGSV